MNRRTLGLAVLATAALYAGVMVSRSEPPDAHPSPRRHATTPPPETGDALSVPASVAPLPSSVAKRQAPDRSETVSSLRKMLETDPGKFLERIEECREDHELAYGRLFPRGGAIPEEERRALMESLWTMALGGRRTAALLAGRFELEEPLLQRMVNFVRSTADGELASWMVQGLRESPANLRHAGVALAEALRFQLCRRDDPQFLGGLADLSGLLREKLPPREWMAVFSAYLDSEAPEDARLHAVRGAAAWPAESTPILLERLAVEPSPPVRMEILRFTSRRLAGRECLLRAIQSDPDPDVRRFAAESARLVCDRSAVDGLERLAASETDDRVVRALQESIETLTRGKTR